MSMRSLVRMIPEKRVNHHHSRPTQLGLVLMMLIIHVLHVHHVIDMYCKVPSMLPARYQAHFLFNESSYLRISSTSRNPDNSNGRGIKIWVNQAVV
jgi:uncharacterized membrane protein